MALLEEEVDFEVSEAPSISSQWSFSVSLCIMPVDQDGISQLFLKSQASLPAAAMFCTIMTLNSNLPELLVPINPFFTSCFDYGVTS